MDQDPQTATGQTRPKSQGRAIQRPCFPPHRLFLAHRVVLSPPERLDILYSTSHCSDSTEPGSLGKRGKWLGSDPAAPTAWPCRRGVRAGRPEAHRLAASYKDQ